MKILAESLSRPRLSVAMIVRDEQEVLAESIESVGKIADEIVVLDTGSTDAGTGRPTRRYGPPHALGERLLRRTQSMPEIRGRKLGPLARCGRTRRGATCGRTTTFPQ